MNKNFYNEQKLNIDALENSFKNKRVSHAYLIVGNVGASLDEFNDFLMQSLVCENANTACLECTLCKKIQKRKYHDFVELDAKKTNVKKEEIHDLIDKFSFTALESRDVKIYNIKNIEYMNKNALNSLLKFLEEPKGNLFAIFTCENINKVLTTIVSRCQIIKLQGKNDEIFEQNLLERKVKPEYSKLLSKTFSNLNEAINFYERPDFETIVSLCSKFCKSIENRDEMIFVAEEIQFRDKEILIFFLEYLILYLTAKKRTNESKIVMDLKSDLNPSTNVDLMINYIINIL